ncbi:MAG: UDP-N-acetylmuramoyl-L-alanyl-D-glutamate--2,6-diaminopimelate ligase, partial [Calditrichia bacterium]|nr:UDP-N-acetylmuramoyl-L-alanyl-D-glutamate--2,6-diaminopimelate ligase [Calditrichia bacterium]
SAAFYDNAVQQLRLVGVTGTNGKSTIVDILHNLLNYNHFNPAMLGTIEYRYGGRQIPAIRTTPESLDLHRHFYEIFAAGHKSVVMEVSSHALALDRVFGLNYEIAVFTNLTHEHLDFHSDMEDYFKEKVKLFTGKNRRFKAVINVDDEYGKRLAEISNGEVFTYGIDNTQAQIRIKKADYNLKGTFLDVITPLGEMHIVSSLIGKFNVYNILAAVGVGVAMGFTYDNITASLQNLPQVSGRCEKIMMNSKSVAVIDYAHTPDALKNICGTLSKLTTNRLLIVFGAGGDRDKEKRPLMGEITQNYGDIIFVTSDNPRNEEPLTIIKDIMDGIEDKAKVIVEIDRRKAIHRALDMAGKGDVVLIAGKGHENYQEIKEKKIHFDYHEIVNQWNEVNYPTGIPLGGLLI